MQLRNIKNHKTTQILKASQMRFLRKLLCHRMKVN